MHGFGRPFDAARADGIVTQELAVLVVGVILGAVLSAAYSPFRANVGSLNICSAAHASVAEVLKLTKQSKDEELVQTCGYSKPDPFSTEPRTGYAPHTLLSSLSSGLGWFFAFGHR